MANPSSVENGASFAELAQANRAFARRYPGPTPDRQPVHTVYGGAHLFRAETTRRLGALALDAMATYGRDPLELGVGVGYIADASSLGAGPEALEDEFTSDPDA